MESRIGGHILADQLALQGVDTVFCVPGESFLPLLDGFYAQSNVIRVINTRHEGGAANMAEAYGKLTGKPGICVVTRGPGACNASIGVHTAFQDSTPMILLIGQVGREMMDREAFQEMDYRRVFGEMAKWVAQIDSAERIPEYLSRAFHVAQSGRPGPVVLAMPEDVLAEVAVAMDVKPARPAEAAPTVEAMTELRNLLLRAERPLMMLGGPTWTSQAVADMRAFAEANTLPVAVSFRAQDRFDNRSPNYAGDVGIGVNPKLAARIKESDLLLVVGPRLGEMTTQGYALMDVPQPNQTLIHVHAGAEELGRVYRPDLAINASMGQFAKAAAALEPVGGGQWKAWTEAANSDYRARLAPTVVPGDVNFGEIVSWLNERLPENAILTNGAGNYTAWVHRFYQYKHFKSQLAPTNGAMGYSVPAAIAAKIVESERMVIKT